MIKSIIFDLSEVIISGFHKDEYIIEKNTNIKAEEFLEQRKEVNDIFIDDSKENIEAAKENGIYGIVFENAKQLEEKLQEMKII